VGALTASDVIHPTEGEVAIPTSVCGPIVYDLEGAEPVCPRGGWQHVQTKRDKRYEKSEQYSRADVREAGVNTPDSLFDVADSSLHDMHVHARSGVDELDPHRGQLWSQGG
jgi:hypothetical protein